MNLTVDAPIAFDAIKTLIVIESEPDLSSIFTEDIKTSYTILRSMAMTDTLPAKTINLLEEFFEKIILKRKSLIEAYSSVSLSTPAKNPPLPRRYGKNRILDDINKTGGKKTELQRAMLAINELRNIYVNLSNRCIKDYVGGAGLLTDMECRDIVATVETAKKKLKVILSKK